MSLSYAESWTRAPESPFVDGQNLQYFNTPTGWQIHADNQSATFVCTNLKDCRYFSSDRTAVADLLGMCPAAGEIFAYGRTPEGFQAFSVPTLERANTFAADRFAGLPTAKIQAFQKTDLGNTSAHGYLGDLSSDEFPKLPVSYGHARHFHDLIDHWLAAAAVDERSFEVYRALCKDALSLWGKEQYPNILYVYSVASGFDRFTGSLLRRTMDQTAKPDGYLLSETLRDLSVRQHDMLPRAISIVQDFGMEVEPAEECKLLTVPWEMENLPSYYDQVAERLSQQ